MTTVTFFREGSAYLGFQAGGHAGHAPRGEMCIRDSLKADYLSPGPFFAGLIVLFRLIRLGMRHKAAGREHMPAPDVPRVAAREHLPISEYFKSVPNGKPERPRTVSFAAIGPVSYTHLLEAAVEAGARYVVVEQDAWQEPSLEAARKSRAYLRSLGW